MNYDYKREFIELALEMGVLRFGEFKLKSGRISPYFFNAGLFNTGRAAARLGRFYAAALVASKIEADMLFGPAYKGIPLAALTAAALAEHHGLDLPYAYNRKEAKTHGEGGQTVGARLSGNVVILDDVITAGTAIGESMKIIEAAGAHATGVIIALDRQERGQGKRSAVQQAEVDYGLRAASIITLDDLLGHLSAGGKEAEYLASLKTYRAEYGV